MGKAPSGTGFSLQHRRRGLRQRMWAPLIRASCYRSATAPVPRGCTGWKWVHRLGANRTKTDRNRTGFQKFQEKRL